MFDVSIRFPAQPLTHVTTQPQEPSERAPLNDRVPMSKVGLFAAWVRKLSWKVALALAVKEGFEFIDGHPGALDFKSTVRVGLGLWIAQG